MKNVKNFSILLQLIHQLLFCCKKTLIRINVSMLINIIVPPNKETDFFEIFLFHHLI